MRTKVTNSIMILTLAGIFLIASPAFAFEGEGKPHGDFPKGGEHHPGKGQIIAEVMDELDLTTEQREQIEQGRAAQHEKDKEIRVQMRTKRKELKRELDKWESDPAKVNQLVDEISDLKKAMFQSQIEGIQATKKILRKDQFEELTHKLEIKEEVAKALRKKHHKGPKGDFRGPKHE